MLHLKTECVGEVESTHSKIGATLCQRRGMSGWRILPQPKMVELINQKLMAQVSTVDGVSGLNRFMIRRSSKKKKKKLSVE